MGKFRVRGYDPRADSSFGTESWRPGFRNDPPGLSGVILDRRTHDGFRTCACGCKRKVAGKATFAMGHDMKLKGILTRAHLTGTPVHVLDDADLSEAKTRTAFEDAANWSTPKLDWQVMLREAEAKQGGDVRDTILRAEREVTERALGVQVGSLKLLKLGRWEYTGHVIAIYEDADEILYEYVSRDGRVQQTRKAREN